MFDLIKVKKIKLYKGDPYFNYAIVILTTGEKFAVLGNLNSSGNLFNVQKKRGSILPYDLRLGTIEEQNKSFDFYFKKKLIEQESCGFMKIVFLEGIYENAIADAILEHKEEMNFDTVITFNDYPPNLTTSA